MLCGGIESISVIILSMNELSSSETPMQEIC